MTVTDSSFSLNSGLVAGGGIGQFNTPLSILQTSMTSNTAPMAGGLSISAGPCPAHGGYVLVRDTTIGGNTATGGQGGRVDNNALSEFINVTIKDNTGGVYNSGAGPVMFAANTVLDNPGRLNGDGDGTLPQYHGGNFSDDSSCSLKSNGDADRAGLDPKLRPLSMDPTDYTWYYLPLTVSLLIDTAFATRSPRDQRGAADPQQMRHWRGGVWLAVPATLGGVHPALRSTAPLPNLKEV